MLMREGGEGGQGGRLGIALASAVPQCQGGRPLECPESLEAAAGRGWGNETKGKERRRSRARAQCRFELLGNVSPATGAPRREGINGHVVTSLKKECDIVEQINAVAAMTSTSMNLVYYQLQAPML